MKRGREEGHQEDDSEPNLKTTSSSSDSEPINNLKKQLNNGSRESSFLKLGNNYFNGEDGVEKDYFKAFEYFLKGASEDGCVESIHHVGYCYDEGFGVEQDYSKAFEWYLKAAEGGLAKSQLNIAVLYENGYGVEEDDIKAFEWYLKSAENNDSEAQFSIGQCYEYGDGVEKDISKAFEWHLKAAENGHVLSQFNVGLFFENGDGVEKDYVKAFEWYLKAAESNDSDAQFNIGRLYDKGLGIEKDYSKAMEWYLKSAENNDSDAQFRIGKLFKYGKDIEKDLSKSFEWFLKAAENGSKLAQHEVGMLFKNGEGTVKDLNKSFYWLTKEHNDADFKIIDLNEFGIEEFKNDDVIETNELTPHESNNELISKVIIRLREKDFSISSNYLSNSKYLTTMMNQNWRNFNQKEGDQIILDLTSIENEIFEQETDHIQIFQIYINYLLNSELPIDFKLDLKLNLIELSRYLGDDQFILQIMRESTVIARYYILFKLEMIQPIHNMIASCYSTQVPLPFRDILENELNVLMNQSELSSLGKQDICKLFVKKNYYKYPKSITFSKLLINTL